MHTLNILNSIPRTSKNFNNRSCKFYKIITYQEKKGEKFCKITIMVAVMSPLINNSPQMHEETPENDKTKCPYLACKPDHGCTIKLIPEETDSPNVRMLQ